MPSGAFANDMVAELPAAAPMLNRSFSDGRTPIASLISKGKTSRPFASSRMKKIPSHEGHPFPFSPSLTPLLTWILWLSHYITVCIGFFPLLIGCGFLEREMEWEEWLPNFIPAPLRSFRERRRRRRVRRQALPLPGFLHYLWLEACRKRVIPCILLVPNRPSLRHSPERV